MIIASGLLEGVGLLAFMIGLPQGFPMPLGGIALTGIALIIVKPVLWRNYREGANKCTPPLAREAIAESDQEIRYSSQLVPAILYLLSIIYSFSDYPAVDLYDRRGRPHWRRRLLEKDGYSARGIFRGFPSSKDAAARLRQLRRPCPARRMAALA